MFRNNIVGEWIPHSNKFILSEPLIYWSERLKMDITVPVGFDTDFSSIPVFAWSLLRLYPSAEGVRKPGCVHDYLYRSGNLPRKVADQLYYDMLRSEGVGYIRAQLCWQTLRMFGGQRYKGEK